MSAPLDDAALDGYVVEVDATGHMTTRPIERGDLAHAPLDDAALQAIRDRADAAKKALGDNIGPHIGWGAAVAVKASQRDVDRILDALATERAEVARLAKTVGRVEAASKRWGREHEEELDAPSMKWEIRAALEGQPHECI